MPRTSLYVPVLKSHRAERKAVRELHGDVRRLMAPIIEVSRATAVKLVGLSARTVAQKVHELIGDCGRGELYLDLGILKDRQDCAAIGTELQRRLLAVQSDVQLVLRLKDLGQPERVQGLGDLLRRNGAGFRVTPTDYLPTYGIEESLANTTALLRHLGLVASSVDLLVDCQVVDQDMPMRGTTALFERQFGWRSITYIGGSFPPNLSGLRKNDQYELPRHEWSCFVRERRPREHTVRYGDYTIQHPLQPDPPVRVLPSGSIRYVSDNYWVVMRGEKLDNPKGPGYQQYIAQARLLTERPEFCGSAFSAGDAYIDVMGHQTQRTGTPESWLQAGINHHLTFVARQLGASLAA